jgi:hypothetical protein
MEGVDDTDCSSVLWWLLSSGVAVLLGFVYYELHFSQLFTAHGDAHCDSVTSNARAQHHFRTVISSFVGTSIATQARK